MKKSHAWRRKDKYYHNFMIIMNYIIIYTNTNYIILYRFHTNVEIHPNPKISSSFFVILITNHCSFTFFSPPASPEAIADKNQRSRISSFATHPYSWNRERSRVLSQFEHGLVRATNQFPHADILERCIEKLVHTSSVCTSPRSLPFFHVPHSVTRFVPRRSRKNTREYSKPTPVSSLSATTSQLFRCHRRW